MENPSGISNRRDSASLIREGVAELQDNPINRVDSDNKIPAEKPANIIIRVFKYIASRIVATVKFVWNKLFPAKSEANTVANQQQLGKDNEGLNASSVDHRLQDSPTQASAEVLLPSNGLMGNKETPDSINFAQTEELTENPLDYQDKDHNNQSTIDTNKVNHTVDTATDVLESFTEDDNPEASPVSIEPTKDASLVSIDLYSDADESEAEEKTLVIKAEYDSQLSYSIEDDNPESSPVSIEAAEDASLVNIDRNLVENNLDANNDQHISTELQQPVKASSTNEDHANIEDLNQNTVEANSEDNQSLGVEEGFEYVSMNIPHGSSEEVASYNRAYNIQERNNEIIGMVKAEFYNIKDMAFNALGSVSIPQPVENLLGLKSRDISVYISNFIRDCELDTIPKESDIREMIKYNEQNEFNELFLGAVIQYYNYSNRQAHEILPVFWNFVDFTNKCIEETNCPAFKENLATFKNQLVNLYVSFFKEVICSLEGLTCVIKPKYATQSSDEVLQKIFGSKYTECPQDKIHHSMIADMPRNHYHITLKNDDKLVWDSSKEKPDSLYNNFLNKKSEDKEGFINYVRNKVLEITENNEEITNNLLTEFTQEQSSTPAILGMRFLMDLFKVGSDRKIVDILVANSERSKNTKRTIEIIYNSYKKTFIINTEYDCKFTFLFSNEKFFGATPVVLNSKKVTMSTQSIYDLNKPVEEAKLQHAKMYFHGEGEL